MSVTSFENTALTSEALDTFARGLDNMSAEDIAILDAGTPEIVIAYRSDGYKALTVWFKLAYRNNDTGRLTVVEIFESRQCRSFDGRDHTPSVRWCARQLRSDLSTAEVPVIVQWHCDGSPRIMAEYAPGEFPKSR